MTTPPASQAGKPLTWTSQPPTVPGWYWMEARLVPGRPAIWIEEINQKHINDPSWMSGLRYAGPIPEPQEPTPNPKSEP